MTLTDRIINLIEQAKSRVARVANSAMVCTNYLIGKLIIEYQQGETRAEYGTNLLQNWARAIPFKIWNVYEIESFQNNWKLEELKRQYNSGLYEQLALSKNKDEVWLLALGKLTHQDLGQMQMSAEEKLVLNMPSAAENHRR
jgi:hypothetical protein